MKALWEKFSSPSCWREEIILLMAIVLSGPIGMATPPELQFSHITKEDGLSATFMFRVMEDKSGIIWMGSRDGGGLYRYDGHSLSAYMSDYNNPFSLSNNNVTCIYQSSDNRIWVGTETGGLNTFIPEKGQFSNYKHDPRDPSSLPTNALWGIMEDSFHDIWIASNSGLSRYLPKEKKFCNYKFMEGEGYIPSVSNNFLCLSQDNIRSHRLWIGTGAGLKSFNKKTEKFTSIDNPFTEGARWQGTNTTRQLPIYDLFQDGTGTLWMGTLGSGLLSYDPYTQKWAQYKFEEILDQAALFSYNAIFDLEWEPPNRIWLGGEKKLGYFDTESQAFQIWEHVGGDSSSMLETGYYSLLIDRNGYLWGGSYMGLSRTLYPIQTRSSPYFPDVHITGIHVKGEPIIAKNQIVYLDSLALDEEYRSFNIQFAAINPPDKNSIEYAYKLEGVDKEWQYTDSIGMAEYRQMWGGSYSFEVKARETGGKWGSVKTLHLELEKPYWQEGWFIFLICALVFSLGFGIYSFFKRMEKEREALMAAFNEELMEMKMSALRSQMNPHFMFNSLNSIKHFMIKNDPKSASRYLSKFSQLMRLILQNSQNALVPLQQELKALELYVELEQLRFEKKFSFQIDMEPGIVPNSLEIPPMVLQPYVENAIWHGLLHKDKEGAIHIGISENQNQINIEITDNGIGREQARSLKSRSAIKSKSYGMQITSERLKMLETQHQIKTKIAVEDLKDASGNALGTQVKLVIPKLITSSDLQPSN